MARKKEISVGVIGFGRGMTVPFLALKVLFVFSLLAQIKPLIAADDPVFPVAKHDKDGNLIPNETYGETIKRGMKFLLEDQTTWAKGNNIKDDEGKIQPPYFFYCVAFNGNGQLENGVSDTHRGTAYPAFFHSYYISTFLEYYIYSGNETALKRAEELARWNLSHSTPSEWKYGNLPYSTSHNGKVGGSIDGDAIMTNKAPIMAEAYLRLYQITLKKEYLKAAENIAGTLVKTQLLDGNWAFRVEPKTGLVREQYTSAVIYAIDLFDKLEKLTANKNYAIAKDKAFQWLLKGPAIDMNWNGFYEDVGGDNSNNRNNYDCIDTACYLITHSADNKAYMPLALKLIDWVKRTFVDEKHLYSPAPGVREQLVCDFRMSAHSAHWAMLLGHLYNETKDNKYRIDMLNIASLITYHLQSDNRITIGPEWAEGKDKYYWYSMNFAGVRGMIKILGYCPESAPDKENHLLSYSASVRSIVYSTDKVTYTTGAKSSDVLKLAFVPSKITLGGKQISAGDGVTSGFKFDAKTNILRLAHTGGEVVITH